MQRIRCSRVARESPHQNRRGQDKSLDCRAQGVLRSISLRPRRQLLCEKAAKNFYPFWPQSAGRRQPVHGAGWKGPLGQQSFQAPVRKRVAYDEFRQDAEPCSRDQGGQHRVPVVHALAPGRPHGSGFAALAGEAPRVGRDRIGVADAVVLRELERVLRPAVFREVSGSPDQIGRHPAQSTRDERGVRQWPRTSAGARARVSSRC
jgi:hypothetical protein